MAMKELIKIRAVLERAVQASRRPAVPGERPATRVITLCRSTPYFAPLDIQDAQCHVIVLGQRQREGDRAIRGIGECVR